MVIADSASDHATRSPASGLCLFQPGQVLVVVLLGILLLAGLIFYVINVGDQLNGRLAMQNAADSTAISGATWMARSMNVVAMNNVAQTRMLALVPILDSFPLAAQLVDAELPDWISNLQQQEAGLGQLSTPMATKTLSQPYPAVSPLQYGCDQLLSRLQREHDIVQPVDQLLNGADFHPERLTFWRLDDQLGPPPHGQLWKAAIALGEFSQSVVDQAPTLSQANAVRYGQANDAADSFVVPVLPTFPGRLGKYQDFAWPVSYGRLPDDLENEALPHPLLPQPSLPPPPPYRLGPFDRLFKWRDYQYQPTNPRQIWVPLSTIQQPAVQMNPPFFDPGGRPVGGNLTPPNSSGSSSTDGSYQTVSDSVLVGYRPYGPFEWMMRQVRAFTNPPGTGQVGPLADTRFYYFMRTLANAKLAYMWGPKPPQLQMIHMPHWVTDYTQAKLLAERGAVPVYQTLLYRVQVASSKNLEDPDFLKPGTYSLTTRNGVQIVGSATVRINGWYDPESHKPPLVRVGQSAWEYQQSGMTDLWPEIGIPPPNTNDAPGTMYKFYVISDYIFGGVDVGEDIPIRDPSNYDSPDDPTLPAPVLIADNAKDYPVVADPGMRLHDSGVRWSQFTWLGVARKPNTPFVWPQRFGSGTPFEQIVELAQVEIFNATSWDLWTQDWKVKLVPVTRWDNWMDRLSQGIDQADQTEGFVPSAAVWETYRYLSSFSSEMAQQMMQH